MADQNGAGDHNDVKMEATEAPLSVEVPKVEAAESGDVKVEEVTEPATSNTGDEATEAAKSVSGDVKDGEPTEEAKSDISSQLASDLELKIIRQVEYYFGDINLPKDKFLRQEINNDEDGWVSLQTMTKFNRLAVLSTDLGVLADALRKSTSGLMELSEDSLKIRRSLDRPLPEFNKDQRENMKMRSVYGKGFPDKATLDDVMEYFEKTGKTDYIQMRRNKDKSFKGSCFVIYATEESAKNFLTMDKMAKHGETEMKRMYKDDYFKMKAEQKRDLKQEDIKKKQEQRDQYIKKQEDERKQNLSDRITHGAVLYMSKIPEGTTREELKEVFEDHGKVCWAEFDKGDTEGKLRFEGEGSAKQALEKALAANEGKVKLGDVELECRVLEGEEELDYWKFMTQQRNKKPGAGNRYNRANQFGRGGRGGRGGYKRKSGGRDDSSSEPHHKVAKSEGD